MRSPILSKQMKDSHWNNERIAERLGMDNEYIRRVTSGNKRPSPELAMAIITTVFPNPECVNPIDIFPKLAEKLPVNSIDTAATKDSSMSRLAKRSTARAHRQSAPTLSSR